MTNERGFAIRTNRRRFLAAALLAVPAPIIATGMPAVASAAYHKGFGHDWYVGSSMGKIKNRVFRAADGSRSRVVIALDGLRATNDISGWERNTEIAATLTKANINVIMPVGGHSSFYTDWQRPSKGVHYKWESYLTGSLRNAMRGVGYRTNRVGIIGLSMGGGAAVILANWHPDMFSFAASMSGLMNPTVPGGSKFIAMAMADEGGFDVNAMWGPPGSPAWSRNDAAVQAPSLAAHKTRLWISAATGIPGAPDFGTPEDLINLPAATGLEALAQIQTRTFELNYTLAGGSNAVFSYPTIGTHRWPYWEDQVNQMLPDLKAHIG